VSSSESPGKTDVQSPAVFTKDPVTGQEYVADQVIVRYNTKKFQSPGIMNAYIKASNEKIGAKVEKDFSDSGLSGLQVLTLPENMTVSDAIAEYKKNPDVLYAEPNYRINLIDAVNRQPLSTPPSYSISSTIPDDFLFPEQWYLYNTGQSILDISGIPGADIQAPGAWDISRGTGTVIVGVVDTGINYSHTDLTGNIWVNAATGDHGWNFTGGASNNLVLDSWGHGTHVAGTIGALTNNGVGVSGVNWNVRLMSLKIFQTSGSVSTIADAINAIQFADAHGVSISSNSWSGTGPFPQSLKEAIDASPALFVAAAGNSGNNIDTSPEYPAALTSDNIISVAASDGDDNLVTLEKTGGIGDRIMELHLSILQRQG
jgi:subtilisin family serine protease